MRLSNGSQVHVEMQRTAQASFRERGLYYWARVHGTQLDRGQNEQRRSWLNTASLEELRNVLETLAVKRLWPLGK